MARRARRPRGRFYAFRRGRWHHLKRLRRRYKFRHRRRQRYRRRAFRKAFHNPRPGTYSVRLPNPQSTMTIRFQGVIFLTEGLILPKNSTAGGYADHMYGARVAKISVNLKEFLLASMNLTYVSKIGGPIAGQRSVSRRSFNHHKARGAGDPKGQRWHTLVPLGTETITDSYMGAPASELDTNFFTLYVAQGTNKSQQYKFGTATYALKEPVMKSDAWAVVRVQSVWQLGNRQRPYPWDVNWANSTMYWGTQP
uniref:Capsid protein n=1 Tax=Chicken anemia virus TaxID=12618 RepID=Q0WYA1_9VIRU|nr:VP1d1 [Chicken anemia virus]